MSAIKDDNRVGVSYNKQRSRNHAGVLMEKIWKKTCRKMI